MRTMVYLIGQPGAGKSTVAAAMTAGYERVDVPEPVPHRAYLNPARSLSYVALGRERETFSGTDTLAMNVQPKVLDWLTSAIAPAFVFGEGDRLGNLRFFEKLYDSGRWVVKVAYLATPDDVAAERRAARGSQQNDTWVRGRITKARRLAAAVDAISLDGTDRPENLARVLLKEMSCG